MNIIQEVNLLALAKLSKGKWLSLDMHAEIRHVLSALCRGKVEVGAPRFMLD